MQVTSIIRDRGQLTIPDSIRRMVNWVTPLSAVNISVIKPDQIIITPHQNYIDWDSIWNNIKKSRAIRGKGHTDAAGFLELDRNSH